MRVGSARYGQRVGRDRPGPAAEGGTEVFVKADDVPQGISASDHEAGIASSLANLAAYVKASGG